MTGRCEIDYAAPGPLTSLEVINPTVLDSVVGTPVEICSPVHALVIQPNDAKAAAALYARDELTVPAELIR